jgi:long-chain acyl-CoA synthetase
MSAPLVALLDAACRAHGATAGAADEHEACTLAQLSARADAAAAALRAAGAEPDEPVAVLVSNRARDLASLLGAWRAGCVAAPVHRTTPPTVAGALLERMGARFVLDSAAEPTAPALLAALGHAPRRVGAAGALFALERPAPPPRPLLRGAALITFTSGTTGQPKGVVLSQAAFTGKLAANDSLLGFGPHTRTLLVLQITFSFGMWVSWLTLSRGGRLFLRERFEPLDTVRTLAGEAVNTVALVPTMSRAILARREEPALGAALEALRAGGALHRLLTGGESIGTALSEAARGLFPGAELVDIYGLTETATSDFFLLPADQPRLLGCIGRPAPGVRYRIADEQGRAVSAGAPGELQIRTDFAMNGYLDAPQLTAAAHADGWFRTGDVAREREPGVVELVGRAKELISRGGNKISPLELEAALAGHPAVGEVMATGVPDALVGERIHVLIVPRPGARPAEADLRAWAAERLERFKQPDVIHFGTALPLGGTGKADRGRLRELIGTGALG